VAISRFIQILPPLPLLKPMGQSRCGVIRIMGVQVRPMIKTIPRFIQIRLPLLPLKPMVQSRRGVKRVGEAQVHPIHALIDPSALRAAKAKKFEEILVYKADGSIKAWGDSDYEGSGAP
jgi:hypothetical protein